MGRHHGLVATALIALAACAPRTNFYPFGDAASTTADGQSDASVDDASVDAAADAPIALPDTGGPVDAPPPPDVEVVPDVPTTPDVTVVNDVGFDAGFDVGFDAGFDVGFDVPDVRTISDVGFDVPDTTPSPPACSGPTPTSTPYSPPRLNIGVCTAEQIAYYYPLTGPSPRVTDDNCGHCILASDPSDPTWGFSVTIPTSTTLVLINVSGCLAVTQGGVALSSATAGCGALDARLDHCFSGVCDPCGPIGTEIRTACAAAALRAGGGCASAATDYRAGCLLSSARVHSCTDVPTDGTPERVRYVRALVNAFCGTGVAPADNTTCAVPSCTGRVCGSDGCGGSCGTCAAGFTCSPTGDRCQ